MRIVGFESACRRELAKLVTHHVFRYVNGEKVLSVVDGEIKPDEIRSYECVDNSPLEVSQHKSFNYSFRSNTKLSPSSGKGDRSLASTKQADFECDTQLNDQSV